MKVTQMDSEASRKILLNLCLNDAFVKEYLVTFSEPVFKGDKGAELIEKWAITYFKKYHKVISNNVSIVYDKVVQSKKVSPEVLKYVDALLVKLNKDLEDYGEDTQTPVEVLLDLAMEEATKRKLSELKDNLSVALENNEFEKANEITKNYKAIEKKEKLPLFCPFKETEKVKRLITEKKPKALITFDGDVGKEWNNVFTEASLVFIEAPAKGKKSYISQMIVGKAFLQGRKVLNLQLGDLTESNTTTRLYGALTARSIEPIDGPVKKVFLDCYKNVDNSCMCVDRICDCKYKDSEGRINADYIPCSICREKGRPFPFTFTHRFKAAPKTLTVEDVEKCNEVLGKKLNPDNYRTLHFSAKKFSIEDLRDLLKTWAEDKENPWVPDVILIDYDKLLKNILPNNKPTMDQVEANVIVANEIRIDFNCCVIINSQARGRDDSLNEFNMLSEDSYSGSIAKRQYATAVISLNKSDEDTANKIQKIGTILNRNGSYLQENNTYMVFLQDMSIGKVCASSFIPTVDDLRLKEAYEKEHGLKKDKFKKQKGRNNGR